MTYRPVWYDADNNMQQGDLTTLQDASTQVSTLRKSGLIAWIENKESERVDENGEVI